MACVYIYMKPYNSTTLNLPPPPTGCFRPFSVGQVVPGTEVKLDSPGPNGDGEICLRGRNIFMGYLHEEGKTRDVFDKEGWLHSGDIGSVDKDGKRERKESEVRRERVKYCSIKWCTMLLTFIHCQC